MNTTKFEIVSIYAEYPYKKRREIKEDCTIASQDTSPEIIKAFDKKEDALLELQNYSTEIKEFSNAGMTFYGVTEYHVEENKYNEDNEWVEGGDVWAVSEMKIQVISEETDECIGTYNSFEEAEKTLDSLEDGGRLVF